MSNELQLTEGQQGVIRMYDREIKDQQVGLDLAQSAFDDGWGDYDNIRYHREQIETLTKERQETLEKWAAKAQQITDSVVEQPASLPAFKPGDRVSISDTSKIRAFRGDVGTITGYFKVTYHVHWDETPDDMTSAIDEADLKGE
jgi:hypothetical protein